MSAESTELRIADRLDSQLSIENRLPPGAVFDPAAVSLARLRNMVAGREPTAKRLQAIQLLATSDFPNKHRDFEAVLRDEGQPSEIRRSVAMALGRIATSEAVGILIDACTIRDPLSLAGVMKALGRSGGIDAYSAVENARAHATGRAAAQAAFASKLIAYRIGLPRETTAPSQDDGREDPVLEIHQDAAHRIRTERADQVTAELALRSLGYRPCGIELIEHPTYVLRCDSDTSVLTFNREIVGDVRTTKLMEQRTIAAVVSHVNRQTGRASPSLVILTSPRRDPEALDVSAYQLTGTRVFVGRGRLEDEFLRFRLRSVRRPGAFPFEFDAVFTGAELQVLSAASGVLVENRREPEVRAPFRLTVPSSH